MTIENKLVKLPSAEHPIAIEAHHGRVRVLIGDRTVADTEHALALREADYPVVFYIPGADVDGALLERSSHTSYCPFKGDASYFSIPSGGVRSQNAAWSYEHPYDAVAEIKDHLAFYPDRVDGIVTD